MYTQLAQNPMCYFRTMAQALKGWQELGARIAEARKVSQLSRPSWLLR